MAKGLWDRDRVEGSEEAHAATEDELAGPLPHAQASVYVPTVATKKDTESESPAAGRFAPSAKSNTRFPRICVNISRG